MNTDPLPQARVFCTDVQWFYQFENGDPVGPFLTQLEAGKAARDIIIADAERRASEFNQRMGYTRRGKSL